MLNLNLSLKWKWLRGLAIWNKLPLRAQGGWLALIPFAAIVISFFVVAFGNRNRQEIETDIERKFSTVTQFNEVQALIVDAETGMRGYLLTNRGEFLAPYRDALEKLPPTLENLKELANAEPKEKPRAEKSARIAELKTQIERRLEYLEEVESSATRRESQTEVFVRLERGKRLMDELRQTLAASEAAEREMLSARINEINDVRRRDFVFVIAALVVGLLSRILAFYLFDRGIVRRIERLTENTRCLQRGETFKFPVSGKTDALGCLETELESLSQNSAKNDKVENTN